MIEKPRFKSHLRVEVVPPDLVLFITDSGFSALEGRLLPLLVPLIDGARSARRMMDRLTGRASPVDVVFGLDHLEAEGLIVEAGGFQRPELASLADSAGVRPDEVTRRLEGVELRVTSLGHLDPAPLRAGLESLGIGTVTGGGNYELVLTDDYLRDELAAVSRRCLDAGRPWLICRPTGPRLWIGPAFGSSTAACWVCLAARLRENRPTEAFLQAHRPSGPATALGPTSSPRILAQMAEHAVALQTARWLLTGEGAEPSCTLVELDPLTLDTRRHAVARLPYCPACGDPRPRATAAPPLLESRPRLPFSDGGYRAVRPEETLRRHARHVSPITGVVGEVTRREAGARAPVEVFVADFASRPDADRREALARGLRRRSAGKGLSGAQARASALCEALEHYSLTYRGDEARRRARQIDLGELAIPPKRCMLYSERQYADRDAWNASGARPLRVPRPLDEEREIDWAPAWSLTENRVKYLPFGYCYYGFRAPEPECAMADSNGNAAGNNLEEAILQGFLELVERDSVALWWHNRALRPEVDLERMPQPYFEELSAYYRSLDREIRLLDVTTDMGIPAVVAVSRAAGSEARALLLGFGSHYRTEIAAARALTEMNQFLPSLLAGSLRPILSRDLDSAAFLTPDPALAPLTRRDPAAAGSDDLRDLVLDCVQRASERGLETLVLDQTRPEIGLPVTKVIVPGLRHFWARFGPGRLYDVPVELGWLDRPLPEERLNPAHLLI